jgi:hypothetical protein
MPTLCRCQATGCSAWPAARRRRVWRRGAERLAPYYAPAATVGHLDASTLTDVAGDVPILEGVPTATCVWAGRLGAIACWQAAREHGVVVAHAATAPKQDLSIPRRIVEAHPYAYHQTWIGSGADFNGYILGDDLVGVLNLDRGRRLLFLIAEVAEAGVEDYSGYWDGEAILGRHQSTAERISRRLFDDETGGDDDGGDGDGSSGVPVPA